MSSRCRLGRRLGCRVRRQPAAGRRRGWLGHRCPTAVAERRGPSADRERRRHRPGTVRHHLDVRPGQRSSFQPGGVLRRRCFRRAAVAHRRGLPTDSDRRLHRRRRAGQRHVRRAGRLVQHPSPHHRTALSRRDRGHGRAGPGHLRPGPHRPHRPRPGGRRRLYRRGLLLHQQHQLRQPGDHHRTHVLRHLRRHRPLLSTRLHRRSAHRRRRRLRPGAPVLPDHRTAPTRRAESPRCLIGGRLGQPLRASWTLVSVAGAQQASVQPGSQSQSCSVSASE